MGVSSDHTAQWANPPLAFFTVSQVVALSMGVSQGTRVNLPFALSQDRCHEAWWQA